MNLRVATLQRLVVLAILGLAIAYLALLRPLAQRVVQEDQPLREIRERLARAMTEAGLPDGTDFRTLEDRLQGLRSAAAAFASASREALPRLEHPPEIRGRLEEPFQLVEFLNESQRRVEELSALAQANRVALTPGLPRGFPRFQQELAQPELLWVQLATVNRIVRTAIRAGVREVNELSVEPLPFVEPADYGPALPATASAASGSTNRWTVLRVHLTTVGNMDALSRLLIGLTFTPAELKRAGFPAELEGRPALFLDQILLRRHQLEAAEQAQLELVVSTVVHKEGL